MSVSWNTVIAFTIAGVSAGWATCVHLMVRPFAMDDQTKLQATDGVVGVLYLIAALCVVGAIVEANRDRVQRFVDKYIFR